MEQDPKTARELGDIGARLTAVERDIKEIKRDVRSMTAAVQQARGGWKTLALLVGLSASVGAALLKLGMWLGALPR